MAILVYVENIEGKFKKSAFEVVSYAKAIANEHSTGVTALSIGNVADDELNKLAAFGASKIVKVDQEQLKQFINKAYASVIALAADSEQADIIVLSNSFSGKGLAPRLAAKLEAGLADGAIELPTFSGTDLHVKKTAFSNKAFATEILSSHKKVIAVNPNAHEPIRSEETPVIEAFAPAVDAGDLNLVIKDIVRATDKISLPEAEIVVSAGRGMKGPENWAMIEELAAALGAATACSKPVSDAGWRPHSEHVGQTGIVVSPNLYIAVGISGAIQHLAGVSSSKNIVVINKDPEAPFFKVADYGIVGDALEIIPKLTAAIQAHKAN